MRIRLLAVAAAVLLTATALITVPLVTPAAAHGGACDAYAPKPKLVAPRTVEVFGSFWCPNGHQKMTITVEIWVRFSGRAWDQWLVQSSSRSGGTSIAHAYEATFFCDHDYKTVVKGLAGSSGTTTHKKTVTSPVLRANCA